MAVGDIITAARYNAIQKAIAAVQGPGGTNPVNNASDDTFGYGQTLISSQVEQFAKVTAQDMLNLRQDLVKARQHQTGQSWASLLTTNAEFLEVINESVKVGDAHTVKYETTATSAITNRLLLGESPTPQFSIETFADPLINGFPRGVRARRTETWRTSLTHEIFADFADYNRARYFFNAGGQIILTPFLGDVPSNANTKTFEWRTLLNTIIKDIRFGYNYSTSTGTGATTNAIGFYQLTTTYQEIFKKSSNPSYAENYYVVNARFTNSNRNTILFEIKFVDDHVSRTVPAVDPVTGVSYTFTNPDEDVLGVLTSEASQRRATGTNVETAGPTFRNGITI
jgi:hypothetical protein